MGESKRPASLDEVMTEEVGKEERNMEEIQEEESEQKAKEKNNYNRFFRKRKKKEKEEEVNEEPPEEKSEGEQETEQSNSSSEEFEEVEIEGIKPGQADAEGEEKEAELQEPKAGAVQTVSTEDEKGRKSSSAENIEEPPFSLVDALFSLEDGVHRFDGYARVPVELLSFPYSFRPQQMEYCSEDLEEIDGVVRKTEEGYEVITLRPLQVAVLELNDFEAEMAAMDEILKIRKDLNLTEKLELFQKEVQLLENAESCSLKDLCCPQSESSPAESVAWLNRVPSAAMSELFDCATLIPELKILLDKGLPVASAAVLGALKETEQESAYDAILGTEYVEKVTFLDVKKAKDIYSYLKMNPDCTVEELRNVINKERVYTLTESELQELVERMVAKKLQGHNMEKQ